MISKSTRILLLASDTHGCGWYRVLNPATILKSEGYAVGVLLPSVGPEGVEKAISEHDVVIYQRPSDKKKNEAVFSGGKPVIVETDDMVDMLTPENPAYKHYQNGSEGIAAYTVAIKEAKGVINSTGYLAAHNRRFGANQAVVPNFIDASLRQWWPRTVYLDDYVRVGWAGSTSHNEDIIPAIVAGATVCSRYPNARLMLMSNVPMLRRIINRYVPREQHKHIDLVNPVEFKDYPNWVNWDIGLAPIKDTEFNRAKSPLKYLEYSAKACATIASSVLPYVETIPEGGALFVSSHTAAAWEEQIEYAVTHIEEMCDMSVRAYNHVIENYILEQKWSTWIEAANNILEGSTQSTQLAPVKLGRNDPCPCGSGKKWKRCHG